MDLTMFCYVLRRRYCLVLVGQSCQYTSSTVQPGGGAPRTGTSALTDTQQTSRETWKKVSLWQQKWRWSFLLRENCNLQGISCCTFVGLMWSFQICRPLELQTTQLSYVTAPFVFTPVWPPPPLVREDFKMGKFPTINLRKISLYFYFIFLAIMSTPKIRGTIKFRVNPKVRGTPRRFLYASLSFRSH